MAEFNTEIRDDLLHLKESLTVSGITSPSALSKIKSARCGVRVTNTADITATTTTDKTLLWDTDGFDTDAWDVLEAKATKISAANAITSARFQHWQMQLMGNAHAMGTDSAVLKVLFLNGAYEKAKFGVPIPRAWRLRFTERELRDNERMLETGRDEILEARSKE